MRVINHIREIRQERLITQVKMAEDLRVTRQTINAIENGDYNPSIQLCLAICKVFGKTLDQIFGEDDDHE